MQTGKDSPAPGAGSPAVLFYTHALVGGGAERVWAQTAAGLHARGYAVSFCVDWEAPENRHLLPPGVTIHVLGRNHLMAMWRLRRLLARHRFIAAFSAVGASNLKLLSAHILSLTRAKIVLSQHGFYAAEAGFLGRLGFHLTPVTSRVAASTIAVSQALRTDLIHRFWAAPDRVALIYNGIDLAPAAQTPDAAALRARPDHVLALGRLVPEKGHMDLLHAMTRLPDSVTLTIAGEGPERQRLEAAIETLGLGGRVSLPGYLIDPAPLYRQAKVLALPSHTEAFGNVVVEAMGHGLAVVATDSGGPKEILDQGRFGAIVPVGDPAAMANALKQALNDPGDPQARYARAGDFAAERVLDTFEKAFLPARAGASTPP